MMCLLYSDATTEATDQTTTVWPDGKDAPPSKNWPSLSSGRDLRVASLSTSAMIKLSTAASVPNIEVSRALGLSVSAPNIYRPPMTGMTVYGAPTSETVLLLDTSAP